MILGSPVSGETEGASVKGEAVAKLDGCDGYSGVGSEVTVSIGRGTTGVNVIVPIEALVGIGLGSATNGTNVPRLDRSVAAGEGNGVEMGASVSVTEGLEVCADPGLLVVPATGDSLGLNVISIVGFEPTGMDEEIVGGTKLGF